MSFSYTNSLDSITKLPEDIGVSTFLLHLYNTNMFTDVHFTVINGQNEASFSAHKMVLAIWSSYFAEEFYGSSEKVNNLIKLLDVNPEAFEVMLKFMYSSKPNIDTLKKACNVYEVAKKFGVRSLMTECYKTLNTVEIKPENVLDVLEASDLMQNDSTKDRCAKIIQERTKEVTESYQLPNISPSTMSVLIDSLNLSRGFKLELFLWIFAWAKNRFVEDHKCGSSRDALKDFLPKLPFLCLSNIEFAELNRSFDQVLEPDEVISIFMNIAIPGSKKMPSWFMKDAVEIIESLDQKLEFTANQNEVLPDSEISIKEIETKLKELLSADVDNNDIVNWIDANVSSNVVRHHAFIRALVLQVLKVSICALDNTDKNKYALDQFTLRKRLPLLRTYVDTLHLELQALYAAQQLMNVLNHPKGVLREIFNYFYDENLITENSFKVWEHRDNPSEQEGKNAALMSAIGFFKWRLRN